MKMINIQIEQGDDESNEDYEMDCITTVNGRYYHDCLQGVLRVLSTHGKRKKSMTKAETKMLEDIRRKAAPYFRGIRHD